MKKLLKHLKEFKDGHLKIICMELEKFETHLHVVDNLGTFGTNDKNYLQHSEESSVTEKQHYKKKIQSINNGLCIIINQINFEKEVLLLIIINFFKSEIKIYSIFLIFQYETRFGTSADCINLSETFKTFGFKVKILENLKKNEMLEKIRNISKNGKKYDCLFLCILSHGYKGE